MIKPCHSSKLCFCVQLQYQSSSAGSSEGVGFDQLTARCLRCSAADLSSLPESRTRLGFSKKMITNNNPPSELGRGRDQRGHCGKKTELLLHVFFSADLYSLVLHPLKILCSSSKCERIANMVLPCKGALLAAACPHR